jgi:hypothetical protein
VGQVISQAGRNETARSMEKPTYSTRVTLDIDMFNGSLPFSSCLSHFETPRRISRQRGTNLDVITGSKAIPNSADLSSERMLEASEFVLRIRSRSTLMKPSSPWLSGFKAVAPHLLRCVHDGYGDKLVGSDRGWSKHRAFRRSARATWLSGRDWFPPGS